jgi:hypothetical protein
MEIFRRQPIPLPQLEYTIQIGETTLIQILEHNKGVFPRSSQRRRGGVHEVENPRTMGMRV